MARNVEIKVRVTEPGALRERVKTMADGPAEVLDQRDVFFCAPEGRLKLRRFPDGRGELIAYCRPDATGPALSDYRIHRTEASESLEGFLAELFGIRGEVRKRRFLYLIGQTRVHLDEVEELGAYLELEVVLSDDQTEVDGARIAERILGELGMSDAERIACAYIDLLEGAQG
jgi:predicted adenylyl cyclase CyaB